MRPRAKGGPEEADGKHQGVYNSLDKPSPTWDMPLYAVPRTSNMLILLGGRRTAYADLINSLVSPALILPGGTRDLRDLPPLGGEVPRSLRAFGWCVRRLTK